MLLGGMSSSRSPRPWPRLHTTAHSARRRPGRGRRGKRTRTTCHGDRSPSSSQLVLFSLYDEEPGGRKSGSSGTPWSILSTSCALLRWCRFSMHLWRSLGTSWWTPPSTHISVPEQVIEVPVISCPPRPLRADLAATQMGRKCSSWSTLWWRPAWAHVASHLFVLRGPCF